MSTFTLVLLKLFKKYFIIFSIAVLYIFNYSPMYLMYQTLLLLVYFKYLVHLTFVTDIVTSDLANKFISNKTASEK